MAEGWDATPDRRAGWVALRTLRQRPAVVGRTESGEAIYEIRSVRAVLPAGGGHFSRLVPCARCGREQRGAALMSPADLDHAPNPMFCDRCAAAPTPEAVPRADRPRQAASPSPPAVVPTPVARAPEPHVSRVLNPLAPARLANPEARLSDVAARLDAWSALKTELGQLASRVSRVLDDHQDKLEKLSESQTDIRADLWEITASHRELGRLQAELNQRLVELAEGVAAPPPTPDPEAGGLRAAFVDELGELRAAIIVLDRRVAEQAAALTAGLGQRDADASAAATDARVAHRQEVEAALADAERQILQSVSDRLRELAEAQEEAGTRLSGLERRLLARDEVAALKASTNVTNARLQAVEDQLGAMATAVAEVRAQISQVAPSTERELHHQVSELAAQFATMAHRLATLDTTRAEAGARPRTAPAPARDLDLLDSLERQLAEAEGRLSQLGDGNAWSPAP